MKILNLNFIIDRVKSHKLNFLTDILLFAIIIYGFHLLWWNGGLEHFLSRYIAFKEMQEFLAHQVSLPASWFVQHIVGYDIHTLHDTLYFPNNGYVAVERSCSGLKQMYEWTALMLLFPGPWKHKLWYLPLGILVIHLENIFRIIVLSIVVMHWPAHWGFIHLWVMRPLFYVVIFILWATWVEKIKAKG